MKKIVGFVNENRYILFLIGILAIVVFYPIYKVGFATYDDAQQFIIGQSSFSAQINKGIELATTQGRIMISFLISNIPFYVDSVFYLKILSIGSILINLFIFLFILNLFIRNTYFILFFLFFFLTFLQNSFDHNLLVSYPLLFQMGFFCLNASLWMLYNYFKKEKLSFLYWSSIFFILSVFIYEMFFAYFLIIIGAFLYKKTFNAKEFMKCLLPYIISLGLYGSIYLIFRTIYPPQYNGVTLDNHFSIISYLKVLIQFSISSIPGYIYFHYKYFFSLYSDYLYGHKDSVLYLIKNANIEWIIKSILTFALSFGLLRNMTKGFNKRKYIAIMVLSIMMIFLPNAIISLSSKYQKWVETGTLQYTVTYFSYFGIVLLCTAFLFMLMNSFKKFKIILVVILSCLFAWLSIITDYSNYYVSKIQSLHQVKWSVMNEFINTNEFRNINAGTKIFAPNLFEKNGFPQSSDYWTNYLQVKTGKNINVVSNLSELEQTSSNTDIYYLNYHQEFKNDIAFITFSKISDMQNNVIYSDHINLFSYSNNKRFTIFGSVKDGSNSSSPRELIINNQSAGILKYNSFAEEVNREANNPTDPIKIDSKNVIVDSIGVSNYTDLNTNNYYLNVKAVFRPNFSELESNGDATWRWSGRQGEIVIENNSDDIKNVTILMTLNTGYKEFSNFNIYSENFNDSFKLNNEGYNYSKNMVLQPNSKMSIILKSEADKVVAPNDTRELVFVLRNFKLNIK